MNYKSDTHVPNQETRLYLGKLYLTGYDASNYAAESAGLRARVALRNAGYDVVVGAVYADTLPNLETIQECIGIVVPDQNYSPVNKWLDVELATATTLGKDFYPVQQWIERAAESEYRARMNQAALENAQADAYAKAKSVPEWKSLADLDAMVNKLSAQKDEETDLCGGDYSDEQVSGGWVDDSDEPKLSVLVEVSQDGFIHVSKNVWATDVKVVVEYL